MMGKVSLEKQSRVVELLKKWKFQRAVMEEVGISSGAIRWIARKMLLTNSAQDRRKSGRPSKLDLGSKGKFVRVSTANPKFTARQVCDESAIITTVPVDTVRRILWDAGLIGCVPLTNCLCRNDTSNFAWNGKNNIRCGRTKCLEESFVQWWIKDWTWS